MNSWINYNSREIAVHNETNDLRERSAVAADNYWPCVSSERNVSFVYELVAEIISEFRVSRDILCLTNNVPFIRYIQPLVMHNKGKKYLITNFL